MAARPRQTRRPKPRKTVDETYVMRSASGKTGIMREEVWQNEANEVVKYNLAYINHHLCQADNGKALGYDNAHGRHERHHMGIVSASSFTTYSVKLTAFYKEMEKLRE